ncbi:PIR Superfamily Protein [Plasmodium ovale curtisi]|uniref:PIR Superfamily Protein n=1 Tax=Plasmodium ovale curtisi TaxID=864141 RepID=A0A1A8XBX0_PLAOA|nr:PIR Superfamily Protein [Plasmodium ovale curtisi]
MQTKGLDIDKLPSNKLTGKLLQGVNFSDLEKDGALDEKQADATSLITQFNQKVMVNFHHTKKSSCADGDLKCCRDLNYYLDLIRAIIKFSKSADDYKEGLVLLVENSWNSRFGKSDYNCQRELDDESVRKRSILKQLYDYCDDKKHIVKEELKYNAYLNTKWDKIISYTNSNNKYLYYNIKYKNINKKVNYKDLLLNTADFLFINCKDLKNYDITFSGEKTINELANLVSVPRPGVHTAAEAGRDGIAGGELHRAEDPRTGAKLGRIFTPDTHHHHDAQPGLAERKGEANGIYEEEAGAPLWETPLSGSFSVAGACFLFFFLYKFSPVGQWIRTLIRRDTSMRKDKYEDEPLLILNHPEHNDHHISYHSISH